MSKSCIIRKHSLCLTVAYTSFSLSLFVRLSVCLSVCLSDSLPLPPPLPLSEKFDENPLFSSSAFPLLSSSSLYLPFLLFFSSFSAFFLIRVLFIREKKKGSRSICCGQAVLSKKNIFLLLLSPSFLILSIARFSVSRYIFSFLITACLSVLKFDFFIDMHMIYLTLICFKYLFLFLSTYLSFIISLYLSIYISLIDLLISLSVYLFFLSVTLPLSKSR